MLPTSLGSLISDLNKVDNRLKLVDMRLDKLEQSLPHYETDSYIDEVLSNIGFELRGCRRILRGE